MQAFLQDFFAKRCEEISNEISSCEWYLQLQDEIIQKRKEITKNMSKEDIKALNDYDMLCLKLHCNTSDQLYITGYNDGSLTPNLTPKTSLQRKMFLVGNETKILQK